MSEVPLYSPDIGPACFPSIYAKVRLSSKPTLAHVGCIMHHYHRMVSCIIIIEANKVRLSSNSTRAAFLSPSPSVFLFLSFSISAVERIGKKKTVRSGHHAFPPTRCADAAAQVSLTVLGAREARDRQQVTSPSTSTRRVSALRQQEPRRIKDGPGHPLRRYPGRSRKFPSARKQVTSHSTERQQVTSP